MLLQKLRARMSARLKGEKGEAGFTLIELLVVMLILGILAAIAIPAFFNQRDKGTDAQAKAAARTAQTAIETYATETGGSYLNATPALLKAIEDTLVTAAGADNIITVPAAAAETYTVTSTAGTGNSFTIQRLAGGTIDFDCTVPAENGRGGCPTNGNWNE